MTQSSAVMTQMLKFKPVA